MALELEGCPTQAGAHQFICLLAEPWALQKHRLWAGRFPENVSLPGKYPFLL